METEYLKDVLLANNPDPDPQKGWSRVSQRKYDLLTWDYGVGDWSVACNLERIGPGTVGWIFRSDRSYGHLAGLIAFTDTPRTVKEPAGQASYCDGLLWRLPREWWIDGARVNAQGWPVKRAPFGTTRRFRNGERLDPADRAILYDLIHPVAQEWLDKAVDRVRA